MPAGVDIVFQRDRDAVQSAAKIAGFGFDVQLRGLRQSLLLHDGDVGVDFGIVDLDPFQAGCVSWVEVISRARRRRDASLMVSLAKSSVPAACAGVLLPAAYSAQAAAVVFTKSRRLISLPVHALDSSAMLAISLFAYV